MVVYVLFSLIMSIFIDLFIMYYCNKHECIHLYSTSVLFESVNLLYVLFRTLYWTDWNRDAPKIESSSLEGRKRKVLVQVGLMLPNALTLDLTTNQLCWADAGKSLLKI